MRSFGILAPMGKGGWLAKVVLLSDLWIACRSVHMLILKGIKIEIVQLHFIAIK